MTLENSTDRELASLVVTHDDQSAFAELVARYNRYIFTICLTYTHNREDAEEATSKVLTKLYRSALLRFRWECPLKQLIGFMARHEGENKRRWNKVRGSNVTSPLSEWQGAEEIDATDPIALSDLMNVIHEGIASVAPRYRPMLTLRMQYVAPKESARRLGLAQGTVKTNLRRGCKELRNVIAARWPELMPYVTKRCLT